MKKSLKRALTIGASILLALALTVAVGALVKWYGLVPSLASSSELTIEERAEKALTYAQRHKMNTDYAILVDYSIPSGTPRIFVWDFNEGRIIARTYVMHGPGGGSTDSTPVFSNRHGSHCSSLGKFKVTKLHGYRNKRGFRVKGLELSNSNAFNRGIMIHQAKWVDRWCCLKYIPLQPACCLGCFTISTKGMNYLEKLISNEEKPILLWSYA